jgi:hypothetical protein
MEDFGGLNPDSPAGGAHHVLAADDSSVPAISSTPLQHARPALLSDSDGESDAASDGGGGEWHVETAEGRAKRAASFLMEDQGLNDFQKREEVDHDFAVIDKFISAKREQKETTRQLMVEGDNMAHGCLDVARFTAFKIVTNRVFEYMIMMIIVCNIVTLSLWQPTEAPNEGRNYTLTFVEQVFLCVYVVEFILLIVADGFWHPKNTTRPAYLKKHENLLDLLIVVVGTIEFVIWIRGGKDSEDNSGFGLAALRALRVLRVLKFVKVLPNLKLIIGVLHSELP